MAAEVPREKVLMYMKAFEDHYNADETAKCADFYTEAHEVDVNGGSVFKGSTRAETAGFLDTLRNKLGGTNIKFSIVKVEGDIHEDVWVADNGAGTCRATWVEVDGDWRMVKDEITFTPKAPLEVAQAADAAAVPPEVVAKIMQAFEDHYNADHTAKSADFYTETAEVDVNEGSVFKGATRAQTADFLDTLRNKLGGTNIKFSIVKIEGNVHEDVWVADNGAGSCRATWAQVDGEWRMVKDEIKFTPKVAV